MVKLVKMSKRLITGKHNSGEDLERGISRIYRMIQNVKN